MPELTRRRYPERHDCWHVFYGDVRVGTIARRVGCPVDVDQWSWICGFYPGMEPGEYQDGTAIDFDHARADFEAAWRRILPTRTEANFQEWRDQRDATARKYALWDAGKKLPPNEWAPGKPCRTWMKCFCGEIFNSHDPEGSYNHRRHIYAEHAREIRHRQTVLQS